jgi:D-sedoheptulose 7-phosphate isomerase
VPDARAAIAEHLEVAARMPELVPEAERLVAAVIATYESGGRLYTFGNGGSAADAQHFAEELVGRFQRERRPLAAQALTADGPLLTCIGNDYAFEQVFERQLQAFARPGDLALAFSTSGRSANIVRGLVAARSAGATTALFAGGDGGPAADHAHIQLVVPSSVTARIQEMHVLLLHLVLDQVDAWAAGG